MSTDDLKIDALEKKLRESERRLSAIADHATDWESWLDSQGNPLWISPSVKAIAGYTVEECMAMPDYPLPIVHPDDRERLAVYCTDGFKSEAGVSAEFRFVRKDGEIRWGAIASQPVRDTDGRVTGHRSTIRDITRRKISEKELVRQWAINNEMTELAEHIMTVGSIQEIADVTLEKARKVTGSSFGYVGYIDHRTGCLVSPTLTRDIWNQCAVLGKKITFEKFTGLWGWVLTNKQPLMTNSPSQDSRSSGVPDGHIQIEKFLAVPAMFGNVLVGQIALANSDRDYEEHDLDTITRFASIFALGITRLQAQEALHWSEERFKKLVTSVTDYIYTVNIESGRALSTTHGPGCLSITGYSAEEFDADQFLWLRMVYEDDRLKVQNQAESILASRNVMRLEHRIIRKDGDIRWIRNTQVPRFNSEGEIVAYDGLISDITEHKKSEDFINNILESIDEGFFVVDRSYKIISANRAFAEQLCVPVEAILGKQCHCIMHDSEQPCFHHGKECAVRNTFNTGQPFKTMTVTKDMRGRQSFFETKSYPMKDNLRNTVAAIVIHIDVTEKKKLEDQLVQAQKMESVGQLAGGVAHDFNNILTAIIGYCNLLEQNVNNDSLAYGYTREILSSAERAASLTQSLLAFSRKQIIEPRPTELNRLIRRLEKMLKRLIGEDIEFSATLSEKELVAKVDPGKIEQVLINLVTNARDAMPAGGSLAIQTAFLEANDWADIQFTLDQDCHYGVIYVTDSGSGIDKEARKKIFEPFFTTKEVGRGTGLGLSIVYGIIKQHGGEIYVETDEDHGTTFRIFLPLVEMPRVEEQDGTQAQLKGGEETILLGEDDSGVRMVMRKILEGAHYTVIEAVDGADVLEKYRDNKEEIDVVLLDVIMPKMSGREAHEEILLINPHVRAIFMSGYTAEHLGRQGALRENVTFMQKPISPVVLLNTIRELLDGRNHAGTAPATPS